MVKSLVQSHKVTHPEGEPKKNLFNHEIGALVTHSFEGKLHIEWDPDAQVTFLGQLPIFIQFLKLGHLFGTWIDECPLRHISPNAPSNINIYGSFLLSLLARHTRYAHIASLIGESVNSPLLEMTKVVIDDSER